MSSREPFPAGRGTPTTTPSAAELLSAMRLPQIARFDASNPAFVELPDFDVPDVTDPAGHPLAPLPSNGSPAAPAPPNAGSRSKVSVARAVSDDCVAGLAAVQALEAATAACKAALIERLLSASQAEDAVLTLDKWQRSISAMSCRAEIAAVLSLTEGAAGGLMERAATLVRTLPATQETLAAGGISWGHAVTVVEECVALGAAGVPASAVQDYEATLLSRSRCTLPVFRDKARRLRERSYPETVPQRTRTAYGQRRVELQRVQDGMSWLSLFLPAPAAEGIWDCCTTVARQAQGPHESRTLTQLRADVAATLLLGQALSRNGFTAPPACSTTWPPEEDGPASPCDDSGGTVPAAGMVPDGGTASTGRGADMVPLGGTASTGRGACTGVGLHGSSPGELEPELPEPGSEPSRDFTLSEHQLPVFDDADYRELEEPPGRPGAPPWPRPPLPTTGEPAGGTPGDTPARSGRFEGLPPMPDALPIVLIPALTLIGVGSAPATLEGYGPISIDVAKRLLAAAPCFYRAFTDPLTGESLDLSPQTRRVTKKMRLMLRASNEFCTFPGCRVKAAHAEMDHITPWQRGGESTVENLEPLDKRHHLLKHFADDKTRSGRPRQDHLPDRAAVRLRGWTPRMTDSGRPGWTSPAGLYYPPTPLEVDAPEYPHWLMEEIGMALNGRPPDLSVAETLLWGVTLTKPDPAGS